MSAMGPWELAARSQELAMQAERLRRDRAGSDRQPKLSVAPTTVEHMFEYDGRPPVGRLGGALDQLAGEELAGLPVAALGEDVVALGVARNRLEAEFARRLVAFDRGGGAAPAGAASTAAWLRHRARLAPGPAAAWVRTARRLADDLTASAAALAAGAVSVRHVEVIAAATADLPAEAVAGGEAILLGAARELDPQRLRHAAVHLRNVVAPERVRADATAAHAGRYLTLAETFGGTVALQGQLDRDRGRPVQLGRPGSGRSQQGAQVHGDVEVRPLAAGIRQPPAVQAAPGELDQGVGPALGRGAVVGGTGWARQRQHRGQHGGPGLRVELALEGDRAPEGLGQGQIAGGMGGGGVGAHPLRRHHVAQVHRGVPQPQRVELAGGAEQDRLTTGR